MHVGRVRGRFWPVTVAWGGRVDWGCGRGASVCGGEVPVIRREVADLFSVATRRERRARSHDCCRHHVIVEAVGTSLPGVAGVDPGRLDMQGPQFPDGD